jgi:hypothetical protein
MSHEGLMAVLVILIDSNAIKEETKNLGGAFTRWYRVTMDDFLKTGRSNLPNKLKGSQQYD